VGTSDAWCVLMGQQPCDCSVRQEGEEGCTCEREARRQRRSAGRDSHPDAEVGGFVKYADWTHNLSRLHIFSVAMHCMEHKLRGAKR
jgi:hypothetical protein